MRASQGIRHSFPSRPEKEDDIAVTSQHQKSRMYQLVRSLSVQDQSNSMMTQGNASKSQFFLDKAYGEVGMGIILIFNAIFIGIEVDYVGPHPPSFIGM
jgi:hypothetical protein